MAEFMREGAKKEQEGKNLKIAWLFPDILFLHGERGNILAFQRMAEAVGIDVNVDRIDFETEEFSPLAYDFIFCPPGEISAFPAIVEWLKPYEEDLRTFIEEGRVLLVTGTSQCIFGKKTERENGSALEGLGLIDCQYKERKTVYGDDLYYTTCYGDEEEMEIFGSQIQMMDIESQEKPFGRLIYGFGNSGTDREEGVRKNNSIFTNTLGPIFVLNPWLTRKIVLKCIKNIGIEMKEFPIDMSLEKKSLETKKEFTAGKVTRLTNCK